jgi:hypothetical protein
MNQTTSLYFDMLFHLFYTVKQGLAFKYPGARMSVDIETFKDGLYSANMDLLEGMGEKNLLQAVFWINPDNDSKYRLFEIILHDHITESVSIWQGKHLFEFRKQQDELHYAYFDKVLTYWDFSGNEESMSENSTLDFDKLQYFISSFIKLARHIDKQSLKYTII